MYTHHFGLNALPFENVPDPAFFFDEGDHARIRSRITESLKAGRGLMVVTGPIGSGKTTLSQRIKSDFSRDIQLIWMAEPPGNSMDLFLFIAQELGLNPETTERTFVLRDIRQSLLKLNAEGTRCLVIIDESHLMTDDVVNGIRMLNNLEEGSQKLVQILLLGQEELLNIINRPEMEPFKQRIATLEIVGKMNAERMRHYISHRIHVAGGDPSLITDTGWEAMDRAFNGGGTPRLINSLCDRSLTVACERGKKAVDVDDVYDAAQGLGLQKEIYFYKISLKQKERGRHLQPPVKDIPPAAEKTADDLRGKPAAAGPLHADNSKIESKTSGTIAEEQRIPFAPDEGDQKSLRMPVVLLLISMAALAVSMFFYCSRAGSPDLPACVVDLLGL